MAARGVARSVGGGGLSRRADRLAALRGRGGDGRALGARYVDLAAGATWPGWTGSTPPHDNIDELRLRPEARSVTADVVLWPRALTIVMNRDAWARLAPAHREILKRAAREAVAPMMRTLRTSDRGGVRSCVSGISRSCARGRRIGRAARRGGACLPSARAGSGRGARSRIRALKAGTAAEPVPTCRGKRSPAVQVAPALVGRWRTHVTRELMAAADRESGESAISGGTSRSRSVPTVALSCAPRAPRLAGGRSVHGQLAAMCCRSSPRARSRRAPEIPGATAGRCFAVPWCCAS